MAEFQHSGQHLTHGKHRISHMASTECIKECNSKTGVPCWFSHELLSDLDQTIKSSQNFIPFLLGIIFQALYLFPVQPSPTQVNNNNCLLRRWGRLLLPFQTIPLLSSLSPSYFNICFSNHSSTLWTPQTLWKIQVLLVSQGQFPFFENKALWVTQWEAKVSTTL